MHKTELPKTLRHKFDIQISEGTADIKHSWLTMDSAVASNGNTVQMAGTEDSQVLTQTREKVDSDTQISEGTADKLLDD